ncbi:ARM repeat-containing protein [Dacryopinax primogenitus]|uniref:Eukaryotic translation initiation factor 3 subunit K n=1 Tax=Dacryopinax primogenitus (strain DJM 731) TaxID=1858805 RepID=M5FNR3_DACPD|nr:ARM repeat-containing protein [Dacryopinax primogenitus]EJT97830.1 ARM repeat-containing protein [Dacryopinax primogenitus]
MAATWIHPASRPTEIDTLVEGVDRYNPANVQYLEDYMYQQTRERGYDCLANLAILKLYQFNPDLYNSDVVIHILLKAITASPGPDFNLCLALLGDRGPYLPTEDPDPLPALLPHLTQLHTLLLTCRFPKFWALYRSPELAPLRENFTIECVGFEDSVREVVARAVRGTFSKIGRDRLGAYLDLKKLDLAEYAHEQGWQMDGHSVVIPPNADNVVKSSVQNEEIKLPQLAKILAHAQLP